MIKSKVIIIESEKKVLNHVNDLIKSLGCQLSSVYTSGEEFLQETDWEFDIAIVETSSSKEVKSLEIAKHLDQHQKPCLFLRSNRNNDELKELARVLPEAIISRSLNREDLCAALKMVKKQLSPKLRIRGPHGVKLLNTNEILYVKSDGSYVEIYTQNGMTLQRKLLREIAKRLPSNFIRIHRSYLVNQNYVDEQTVGHMIINERKLPISRSYKSLVS